MDENYTVVFTLNREVLVKYKNKKYKLNLSEEEYEIFVKIIGSCGKQKVSGNALK